MLRLQDMKCKYPAATGHNLKVSSNPAETSCTLAMAKEVYEGLLSVPWRRVVANAHHRPMPRNMYFGSTENSQDQGLSCNSFLITGRHVFLIGKRSEQFDREMPSCKKGSFKCLSRE